MRHLTITALGLAAVPILMTAAVQAEPWQCTFRTECFEEETCQDTDFELDLGRLEGGTGDGFLMSDIAGERPMHEVAVQDAPDQRAFVSRVQDTSVQLISIYPDGAAHYTVHAAGSPPFIVTYRGSCEAQP